MDFSSKCDKIRRTVDLVTFTEEIFYRKYRFLCCKNPLRSEVSICRYTIE